jgi:N utilization substance protein A
MSNKVIKDASSLGQFHSAISQICEEKGLDKKSVISTIESALAAAYKKDYGRKGQIIISHIEVESGNAKFKQLKEVVDESLRNMEDLEKNEIDNDDFLSKAKISSEEIESRSVQFFKEEKDYLPRFNSDKDVLLKDAKKIDKNIKIGDFLEIDLPSEGDYGRVASQTAKQVIIQRLREAERMSMFEEYKSKEGQIINGSIHRIEGRNVYIDLGKSIGILYPSEQIPREYYGIGQRIRVYIKKVTEDSGRNSGITLSRASAGLAEKLFELEVPEIFTKTIEIKASAREAGSRTKIAVISNDQDIDPIGSCVGQKGTRVQAVIEELGGERIDIISWSDKTEKFIANSLSPARIVKVELKEDERKAVVYVEADQFSFAIGQRGQNVRLASKLTGWKIDVVKINENPENLEENSEENLTEKNQGDEKLNEEKDKPTDEKQEKEIKDEKKKVEKSTKEKKTTSKTDKKTKKEKNGVKAKPTVKKEKTKKKKVASKKKVTKKEEKSNN